jgi:hypothetical protein
MMMMPTSGRMTIPTSRGMRGMGKVFCQYSEISAPSSSC